MSNDYTVRFANRSYRLHKPALPGLRGGEVVEERLDGTMVIRIGPRHLKYSDVAGGPAPGLRPRTPGV